MSYLWELEDLQRKLETGRVLSGNEESQIKACQWAIDQLRWRRVEEETPQTSGLYAITYSGCVGFSWWDENGWDEDDAEYWRPVTLPDEE